jgi:hypothetical protein
MFKWRYRSKYYLSPSKMVASDQILVPAALPQQANVPPTQGIEGVAGSRATLDAVEKRKVSYLCRDSNPDSSAISILSARSL